MTDPWLLLLLLFFVAASAAQRIIGMGFGIVAMPAAALVLGPRTAISFVAIVGATAGLAALAQTARDLKVRQVMPLCLVTLVGLILAVGLARMIPPAASGVAAGTLVIASTLLTTSGGQGRAGRLLSKVVPAGLFAGLMGGLAGLAGPAVAVHGRLQEWNASFVPNAQVVLLCTVPGAVVANGWPSDVGTGLAAAALVCVGAGTVLGGWASARVAPRVVATATTWVALAGGVTVLVKGLQALAA